MEKEYKMADATPPENPDINAAQPEKLPEPTFWPITLAAGLMFLFWGFTTSLIISGLGFIIVVIAIIGWIGDLGDE